MGTKEIIELAKNLRQKHDTRDPFKLCEILEFEVGEMNLKPSVYKAYTINANKPRIVINRFFTEKSKRILCSHELGHALLHDNAINEFNDNDLQKEYEADLFAVALLFDDNDFDLPISKMSESMLKSILNCNLEEITQ